jgi:hypothetical protein
MVLRIQKSEKGISAIVKGNHSRMVFLDTSLHVDAVTDVSKLPWHKYLRESSPKTAILTTLLPQCFQLWTAQKL